MVQICFIDIKQIYTIWDISFNINQNIALEPLNISSMESESKWYQNDVLSFF